MIREHQIKADNVEKLVVRVSHQGANTVNNRHMPDICMQHMCAVMLLDSFVTFKSSHDEKRMRDKKVLDLRSRIELYGDDELTRVMPSRQGIVELKLRDGRELRLHTKAVRGTSDSPMSRRKSTKKATTCSRRCSAKPARANCATPCGTSRSSPTRASCVRCCKPEFAMALKLKPAAGVITIGVAACAHCALAQPYPSKPIRMIVISAPGGSTDILSRAVGKSMTETLGQTIVLDNKPGGGGIIATETTAKAPPDGYTILMSNTSHSVLPSLHAKLPYDPIKDFAPVSLVALTHSLLLVNPQLPVKNVKELIDLARAQPGKLNYASGTTGASAHFGAELLKLMAKVNIVQVPYKGTAGQLTALIANEVQMSFVTMPSALPHVNAGRLRALAIGSPRRSPDFARRCPPLRNRACPDSISAHGTAFSRPRARRRH